MTCFLHSKFSHHSIDIHRLFGFLLATSIHDFQLLFNTCLIKPNETRVQKDPFQTSRGWDESQDGKETLNAHIFSGNSKSSVTNRMMPNELAKRCALEPGRSYLAYWIHFNLLLEFDLSACGQSYPYVLYLFTVGKNIPSKNIAKVSFAYSLGLIPLWCSFFVNNK